MSSPGGHSCCSSRRESFSPLFNMHGRDNDGTSSIFRANVLGPGSDGFNSNYDRDSVSFDEGRQQPAVRRRPGRFDPARFRLRRGHDADLDHRVRGNREQQPGRHRRRIRRRSSRRSVGPCPPGNHRASIPASCSRHKRRTASTTSTSSRRNSASPRRRREQLFWQAGVYYFDSKFSRSDSCRSSSPPTTVKHENTAWAVFGHVSYDVSDDLTLSGGRALHGR